VTPEHALLVAIGTALLAHCPHRLGHSEAWHRDPDAEWRIVREPCQACADLRAALAGTVAPVSGPRTG
jgi:hypothetical protein